MHGASVCVTINGRSGGSISCYTDSACRPADAFKHMYERAPTNVSSDVCLNAHSNGGPPWHTQNRDQYKLINASAISLPPAIIYSSATAEINTQTHSRTNH